MWSDFLRRLDMAAQGPAEEMKEELVVQMGEVECGTSTMVVGVREVVACISSVANSERCGKRTLSV